MQYLSFSVRLISLSLMPSNFIYVFTNGRTFLFFFQDKGNVYNSLIFFLSFPFLPFPSLFLSLPVSLSFFCHPCWARDQILAAVVTYTAAVAVPDPLTHCVGPEIKPGSWCCRDAVEPIASQWELQSINLLNADTIIFHV